MDKISVMIIAKNEESRIREALQSAEWADEIVVVDSFSNDRTVEIARQFTDKIYQRTFDDFSRQKNFALSKCSNSWVLSIDCDERISPRLQKSIVSAVDSSSGFSAYKVKRINRIFGRELKHAAGNDYQIRLFKKEDARFLQPIHEVLGIKGDIGVLEGELMHISTTNIESEFSKTEQYTEYEAKWLLERNIRPSIIKLYFYPVFVFMNLFVLRRGFLDGYAGFLFAIVSARYSFIKYLKARRLFKNSAYLENKISRRFNELHKQFPDTIDTSDARLKALLEAISDFDGKHILEVGCGKGRFIREIAKRNARCVGIDVSENFLKDAQAKKRGTFLKASATRLPFGSKTFDVVFAVEVIEHLPDLKGFFEEASRVLKDEGRLIIIDRNKFSLNNRRFMAPNLLIKKYHEMKNEWMYPNNFPFRERWFNPHSISKLFIKYFSNSGYEYVLSDGERTKWWHLIFRMIPQARHFVLWHGKNKYGSKQAHKTINHSEAVKKEFGIRGSSVIEKVARKPGTVDLTGVKNPLSGVFCLRIDADEYDRDSFARYNDIFKRYKDAITIFFNINAFKDDLFEIKKCKEMGLDIQSHGFYHHTYNDYESNRYNIKKAKIVFEELGVPTKGFASPMGKWNWALMKALEDEGYEYSSDFAYDYLSIPGYPLKRGRRSGVLEIPIFPVAPELYYQNGVNKKEVAISYYKNAIDEMLRCDLPVIIYAHTSVHHKEIPQIIDEVTRYAIVEKRLKPKTMTEISRLWQNKPLSAGARPVLSTPAEDYIGREIKVSFYGRIKTAIKDYFDFERITPLDELRGPFVRRSVKRFLRRIL